MELGDSSSGCLSKVFLRAVLSFVLSILFIHYITVDNPGLFPNFSWNDSPTIIISTFFLVHLIIAIYNMIIRINTVKEINGKLNYQINSLRNDIKDLEKREKETEEELINTKIRYENFLNK